MSKTVAEQISAFESKRQASTGRMNEIMAKAADEGRTLDETETQEYDSLKAEVNAVDNHIVRLKDHEAQMVGRATPLAVGKIDDPVKGSQARSGIISVKSNVPPGIKFTRYVMALARTRGNLSDALAVAKANKAWADTTPEVEMVLRAAVAAGDTTSAGWASELVYAQNLANEFIEFLRPQTILGKIPNLTQIPFNVRMGSQTSASAAYWVGQGAPVPVSKMGTSEVRLGIAKAAGMVVLTEELVRSSSPSAELLVRSDLTKSIAQFLDQQFIDPDFAAVTNVSPGSVTNGVTPTAASGVDAAALRDDVQTLFGIWIANNLDPSAGVWIMPPAVALAISLMLNPLGQPLYPTINMMGGTFFGLPVITSNTAVLGGSPTAGNIIVLLNAPEILLADDGQVTIDASREAAIQMVDNPTNESVGGTVATSMVSMFQTESVAIRATRFINWKKRRTNAVAFIAGAAYK